MLGSRVMMPHGDLQESHGGFGFEIHDERRIERDVLRRQLVLFVRLRFLAPLASRLAGEPEVRTRTAAAEHQHRDDDR